MLKHRLITGGLLILFLVLLAWADQCLTGPGSWFPSGLLLMLATCGLVVPLLSLEVTEVLRRIGSRASGWVTVIGATVLCFTMWLAATPGWEDHRFVAGLPGLVLAVVLVLGFIDACGGRRTKGVVLEVAGTLYAVLYAGGLMGFWLMLRQDVGAWVIMGAVLTVKVADIGAYAVGCSVGRTRLIPWLSPKKTWEGLVGGIACATLAGILLALWSRDLPGGDGGVPLLQGLLFGFLAAWVGLIGDLMASAMKRDARIKDSSRILPGLGGLIDTLDSLLVAGPLAWWLLG